MFSNCQNKSFSWITTMKTDQIFDFLAKVNINQHLSLASLYDKYISNNNGQKNNIINYIVQQPTLLPSIYLLVSSVNSKNVICFLKGIKLIKTSNFGTQNMIKQNH